MHEGGFARNRLNPNNHVNPVKHAFRVGRFYRIYRIEHDLQDDHGHAKPTFSGNAE